jgi:hemoglobin-like flavoprotein
MALDVALLRESFALVLERQNNLTARFYAILFERYPATQPMFHPSRRARQEQMLARSSPSSITSKTRRGSRRPSAASVKSTSATA